MNKKIYSMLIIASMILGAVTVQMGAQLDSIYVDKNNTTDTENNSHTWIYDAFDNYNDSVDKIFQSQFDGDEEDVVVTCYTFGMPGEPSKEIEMSQHEAEYLYEKIKELNFEVARDPLSDRTQQLQDEIVDLADGYDLLPVGLSKSEVKEQLVHSFIPQTNGKGILPQTQNKASEFLCTFVSTGSGGVLPIIALPRLIPILMIPIPRLFMRWKAQDALTSCGGLRSGTGFIAYGQQKGMALGFWGLGFTFSLPPLMGVYGLVGYALFATVNAEEIGFYPPNSPPVISQIDPYNGEINVPLSTSELQFEIFDYDGDMMSYMVTTTPDVGLGSGNLKPDGVYSVPISGLEDLTEYSWHIEVTDDMDTTVDDFTFTTEAIAPIVSNPSPQDDEKYVPVSLSQLSFHLKDFQGDPMHYTVETVPDIGSASATGVGDGTHFVPVSDLDYSVEYVWYVNVTDGEHQTNKIFNFQTEHEMTFDPFDEGWQYRKEINIDHTKVEGDLEYFPVLIHTIDGDLQDKAQGDGDDILFMDGTDVANRLYHEIESYYSSSGELVVWVNIANIDSNQDTTLYMYYGNPSCCSQQAPELVWDSTFEAVWHMDDASISSITDSTLNVNTGNKQSSNNPLETFNGKIGKAQDFERDYHSYITAHGTYAVDEDDETTFSGWFKQESNEPDMRSVVMSTQEGAIGRYVTLWVFEDDDDPSERKGAISSGDNHVSYTTLSNEPCELDTWYYIAGVMDRTNGFQYIYIDGVQQDHKHDISTLGSCDDGNNLFYMGVHDPDNGLIGYWDGILDELRVSNVARSSAWISTSYNNQNDPVSFMSIEPEETAH